MKYLQKLPQPELHIIIIINDKCGEHIYNKFSFNFEGLEIEDSINNAYFWNMVWVE